MVKINKVKTAIFELCSFYLNTCSLDFFQSDNCAFSRGPQTKIPPLEGNSTINDDDNTNGGNCKF